MILYKSITHVYIVQLQWLQSAGPMSPEGTKRATSVNVQLPCLQKDPRTGGGGGAKRAAAPRDEAPRSVMRCHSGFDAACLASLA